MKNMRKDRIILTISIICFFLMSISFVLMPFERMRILPGALFWGGLTVGIILQIVLEVRRRLFFTKYNAKREKMQKPRNGLLTFGSNRPAIIADTTMGISLVATILTFIITKGTGFLCYVFIATTLFAFCLHCILNGRIYFHAKNQIKIRQMLEQKMGNAQNKGEGEK